MLKGCIALVFLTLFAHGAKAQFGTKTDFYFGLQPFSIALGDIDGDGRIDVVSANQNGRDVTVRLGQPSGSIGTGSVGFSNYGTGNDSPFDVALGDLNNDGRLDIVTANVGTTTCSISVFTNTGLPPVLNSSAAFSRTTYTAARGTEGIALGDVNGDGRLDIVIGSQSGSAVSVMLGLSSGGFGTKTDYITGPGPRSIIVRDVNGDGRRDIVAANQRSASISVLIGLAGGGFAPKADYITGNGPSALAAGDVNGDGLLDIVTSNAGAGASTVSVLLGAAGGIFGPKTDYATGLFPTSVALGDVNNDGRLDIAATNPTVNNASVLLGQSNGIFGPKTDYATGRYPQDIALGDINNDGRLDLFSANATDNSVSVLLNQLSPLATATQSVLARWDIYPNPGSEFFTVKVPQSAKTGQQALLLNVVGQIVKVFALSGGETVLDISTLTPGVYTLQAYLDNRLFTRRITIVH